jgi:hypothetical protein
MMNVTDLDRVPTQHEGRDSRSHRMARRVSLGVIALVVGSIVMGSAITSQRPDAVRGGLSTNQDPTETSGVDVETGLNAYGPVAGELVLTAFGARGQFSDADGAFLGAIRLVDEIGALTVGMDGTWEWLAPANRPLVVAVLVEADDGEHLVAEHSFVWSSPAV